MEPEPNDRVRNAGRRGRRRERGIHLAIVEPLPHLPVHLTDLDVSVECPIIPAPDPGAAAADLSGPLEDLANPDPYEQMRDTKACSLSSMLRRSSGRRDRSRRCTIEGSANS